MTATPMAQSSRMTDVRQVENSIVFDWVMIALFAWFTAGLYLDVWAHVHLSVIETFFTPWHAVLYSGFLASAAVLYLTMVRNQLKGYDWRHAVSKGYDLSLIGATIFLIGGVGDMFWHIAFGVEDDIEAVYSPTHLLLGLGGGLMGSGPIRAAWYRVNEGPVTWKQWLPAILSLTFLVSLFTALSTNFHPLTNLWGGGGRFWESDAEMGVISVVLSSVILIVPILLLVRRWTLPAGTLTILFSINALAMGFTHPDAYPIVPVVAIGLSGAVADLMVWVMRPSVDRVGQLRLFAFLTPGIWALFYFLSIQVTDGISWTVHLWGGTVFISAIGGWMLSYLLIPPQIPDSVVQARDTTAD